MRWFLLVPWQLLATLFVLVLADIMLPTIVCVHAVQTDISLPNTLRNSIGMEFVLVPAGEFMMGSNDGGSEEQPIHRVRISQPFYLGKYEVTQRQWETLMRVNPSAFKGNRNLPVEGVSFRAVQEFIGRLNAKEGVSLYRLPTEAEWEYAARGVDGRTFPWGNDFNPTSLNSCDWACNRWFFKPRGEPVVREEDKPIHDGYHFTAPVGSYQKGQSAFGIYDMAGNVWERVIDWLGKYSAEPQTDPVVVPTQQEVTMIDLADGQRVPFNPRWIIRGGSWLEGHDKCRATYRTSVIGDAPGGGTIGFRLLREVP
jgi:formylglycine-generating enzyme required for sulfatase activity